MSGNEPDRQALFNNRNRREWTTARKRETPPSPRFLGRRVYLAAIVSADCDAGNTASPHPGWRGAVGGATCLRQRHSARWCAPPSCRRSSTMESRQPCSIASLARNPIGSSHSCAAIPHGSAVATLDDGRRRPAEDARRQPRNAPPRFCPRSKGALAWPGNPGLGRIRDGLAARQGQCRSKTLRMVQAAWCRSPCQIRRPSLSATANRSKCGIKRAMMDDCRQGDDKGDKRCLRNDPENGVLIRSFVWAHR
jgi:hypothetical protein